MNSVAGLIALAGLAVAQIPTVTTEDNNPCSGRIISAVIDLTPSCMWTDPHRLRVDAAQALFDYFPLVPYPTTIINDPFRGNYLTVFSIHDEGHENGQQNGAEEIKVVTEPLKEEGAWAWVSGTNIASGIEIAMDRKRIIPVMDHQYDIGRDRTAIVVFTDGLDTTHNKRRLMDALYTAQGRGIRVHWATMAVPGVDKESFAKDQYWFDGDGVQFFDDEAKKAVTATGGVYGTITDRASMYAFVKKVIDNGATNFDKICKHEGGPIDNNVTANGFCSSNSRAMYTYTAEQDKETIEFTVNLVSKKNPVTLTVTYENSATGERTEVKVNKDQPTGQLTGAASKGQQVRLTISPDGASNDECSYSVSLKANGGGGPLTTSSTSHSPSPSSHASSATSSATSSSSSTSQTASASASSSSASYSTSHTASATSSSSSSISRSSSATPSSSSTSQSSSATPSSSSTSQSSSATPSSSSTSHCACAPTPVTVTSTVVSTVVQTVTVKA